MQENHSFDNYFGTYPGADGIPKDVCMPSRPRAGSDAAAASSRSASATAPIAGPRPQRRGVSDAQYDGGKMDGFVARSDAQRAGRRRPRPWATTTTATSPTTGTSPTTTSSSTASSPRRTAGSVANHMYWVTGDARRHRHGDAIPPSGFDDLPTIFDRLEAEGRLVEVLRPELRPEDHLPQPRRRRPRRRRSSGCRCSTTPASSTTRSCSSTSSTIERVLRGPRAAARCRPSRTSPRRARASTRPAASRPARRSSARSSTR